ncbi:MAG: hypothetical protein KME25_18350 [Symplocastrum torsivum CPER-KK1]|jgi:hypothetical protein|uniref:Uncharacterized protein n=1 Tax=Symplocastrum torsivum CPER-KK1 TaxID=450513 RepID=A0A951PLZ3_9CYAN|nr:hypothetical protein [Symplocastrum torsivum CPER-KK1]
MIPIDECEKLHPEQWVKVYEVLHEQCDYIITCQVHQLDCVFSGYKKIWWDGFVLEPTNEEGQLIPIEKALLR